ncbi:Ger(x)C family spore germination protein [Paenibacillus macerans]|uniref:Ger(x)C family spore germination protein n=1 Tax=Paenibacillus macerans TaxID=44252 RepID=UPI00203DA906|nr:Ger(x)C family spore germination protein [Paenibacillus macerans]MCM3699541.1 Ger(x)C family spore germination protein [Paenibacillus macerans]
MVRTLKSTLCGFLLIMLLPALLSGCWERKELNELAFVLGYGLDKEGDQFKVSMQVVIPSEIATSTTAKGGGMPVTVYDFKVKTIYEALHEFTLASSRSSYLGHIRVLVLGEELARDGIGKVLDVIIRSREPRSDFYIMVARDAQASEVLQFLTPLDKLPANRLYYSLQKSSKATARTTPVTIDKLVNRLVAEGRNVALSGIEIVGDRSVDGGAKNLESTRPKASLLLRGLGVFRKDKLLGWLNEMETIGYNYIMGEVSGSAGPVMGEDGKPIVMEVLRSSTKRKVKIIGGEPHIYITVRATVNVESTQSTDRLDDDRMIRELEKKSEERIIYLMENAADHIIEKYNSDILGFGQLIYQSHPKVWEKLKEERETYLKTLPVHYQASVHINRIGTIDKSFQDDIKG